MSIKLENKDREVMIRYLVTADMESVHDDPQMAEDWVEYGRIGIRSRSDKELIQAYRVHNADYKVGDEISDFIEEASADIRAIKIDLELIPEPLRKFIKEEKS